MRKVVVNTTPLIALSHVDKLDVLKRLYGEIIIPEAVYRAVYKNRIFLYQFCTKCRYRYEDWRKTCVI